MDDLFADHGDPLMPYSTGIEIDTNGDGVADIVEYDTNHDGYHETMIDDLPPPGECTPASARRPRPIR